MSTRGQVFRRCKFQAIAWSDLDLAENAGPADAGMQAEAVEELVRQVVGTVGILATKPTAAWRARQLTDTSARRSTRAN